MASDADEPTPAQLGALCVELALGGADLVRANGDRAFSVTAKSTGTDLVTDVDRACESWLLDRLRTRRPDDGVLAEEGGAAGGRNEIRWVLDPIDGTTNFVLGLPQYAVSVAVEVAGTAVAGAVANPVTGELFHAVLGSGAYLRRGTSDTRLSGPRTVALSRAVVGTGFAYDAAVRERQMAVTAALITRIADVRRLGSAALDLCYLAAGRLDAYFEAGTNRWDHAAGGLVATEAGCVTSGLRHAVPGRRMYAAAGAALAGEFFALLELVSADEVVT